VKPLIIPELGCAPYASKPPWIERSISDLQRLGAKAVVYFDENPGPNWRLDSDSSSLGTAHYWYTGGGSSNVGYLGHGISSISQIDTLIHTGQANW
jgi:hypothetical protein